MYFFFSSSFLLSTTGHCTLCQFALFRLLLDLFNGLRLGTKKPTRTNVFLGVVFLSCTVFALGVVVLFGLVGQQCDHRSHWYHCRARVLLFGRRLPHHCGHTRLARATVVGRTHAVETIVW